jgi:hypothetical protein
MIENKCLISAADFIKQLFHHEALIFFLRALRGEEFRKRDRTEYSSLCASFTSCSEQKSCAIRVYSFLDIALYYSEL